MCPKGGQMCQMESVRLSINEHMTSVVGEDILCVLEKQSDACCVKLVRVFVLERLSAAAEWMCNLFQREIETLETLLDHQSKLLDMAFNVDTQLHTAGSGAPVKMIGPEAAKTLSIKQEPEDQLDTNYLHPPSASEELVCPSPSPAPHPRPSASEELVSPGPSLVQGGEAEGGGPLQRPQEGAGGSSFMAGKSEEEEEEEEDDDGDEDEDDDEDDTEPLASTSAELMQDGGTAPPPVDVQLISSDSEEWEESGRGDGVSAFNTLKPHKSHHAEGQRWFICPVCGKSFNRNDNLKIHMRIHTGDKPFSCPVCGKSFTLNENMKTHMRIHTNEKPFSCTLCDKSFVQKIKLKLHMTAHTGEKPFYCAVCNKSFNRTENLKTHMLTHTGEKPYGCSLCDQRFSQNSTLKRHMRVHTGEKPFSCTLCEQSFTVNHHLKRHMLTHAAEKP